jgi:hypothetical protein
LRRIKATTSAKGSERTRVNAVGEFRCRALNAAATVRPFQQQGDVEFPKALAQALLQLLLARRNDAHPIIDLRGPRSAAKKRTASSG